MVQEGFIGNIITSILEMIKKFIRWIEDKVLMIFDKNYRETKKKVDKLDELYRNLEKDTDADIKDYMESMMLFFFLPDLLGRLWMKQNSM